MISLAIPSLYDKRHYLEKMFDSMRQYDIFSLFDDGIIVLAQNYSKDYLKDLKKKFPEVTWINKTFEKGTTISSIREYLRTHIPESRIYLLEDDDIIFNGGSREYLDNCIKRFKSREFKKVAVATLYNGYGEGMEYTVTDTLMNMSQNCGILIKGSFYRNKPYDESFETSEDVALFIESYLDGYDNAKFYEAPISDDAPVGLSKSSNSTYVRTNKGQGTLQTDGINKYYADGFIVWRPFGFTNKGDYIHNLNKRKI